MTAPFEQIAYDIADGIATITLARPEKLNAASGVMIAELLAAFDLADADDAVGALIVTGAGRAFCSGADLTRGVGTFVHPGTEELAPIDGLPAWRQEAAREMGGALALRMYNLRKPIIAAINGGCAGFGASLPLPMDIRLASTTAKFGFVYARRGMVPEVCSSFFLPRLVGVSKALEWCMTGRMVSAEEALRERLVSAVHAPEDLLPAARALAREIVDNAAPVSVALTRQMLWRGLEMAHPMEAHRVESWGTFTRSRTPDVGEGVRAFLDKRLPQFPETVSRDIPEFYPWWDDPAWQ